MDTAFARTESPRNDRGGQCAMNDGKSWDDWLPGLQTLRRYELA